MKASLNCFKFINASLGVSPNEGKQAALPALFIGTTAMYGVYTVWKMYHAQKMEDETLKELNILKAKQEKHCAEKQFDVFADMALYQYKEEYKKKEEAGNNAIPEEDDFTPDELISTSSYNDMVKNDVPLEWIVEPLIARGMVNVILGCGGVGKSLALVASAISSSTGTHVEYVPGTSTPTRSNTIFYRTEEYPGEYSEKYGEGGILSKSDIHWRTKSNMGNNFSLDGLLKELSYFAKTLTQDTVVCIDTVNKIPGYDHRKFIRGIDDVQEIAKSRGIVLTFIVAAHYDEIEPHKPLYTKDITGGDGLIQEAGSVFAIRKERTSDKSRFIQVLKEAKGSSFDTSKVIVAHIEKKEIDEKNWYTCLVYDTTKPMVEALPKKIKVNSDDESDDDDKPVAPRKNDVLWEEDRVNRLKELTEQGLSQNAIAKTLTEEFDCQYYQAQIGRKQVELGIKTNTKSHKK